MPPKATAAAAAPSTANMQLLEKRLDTFKKGWPHGKNDPNVAKIAAVGFFFVGKAKKDTVRCVHCETDVDGWAGAADPIAKHRGVNTDCVITALHKESSRLQTFANWPLKQPTKKKMAQAGFVFRPTEDSPDMAVCFACDLGLGGWESSDNPEHEHRKRNDTCRFLRGDVVEPVEVAMEATPAAAAAKQPPVQEPAQEVPAPTPAKRTAGAHAPSMIPAPTPAKRAAPAREPSAAPAVAIAASAAVAPTPSRKPLLTKAVVQPEEPMVVLEEKTHAAEEPSLLSQDELNMTVEQFLRKEIEMQVALLQAENDTMIANFQKRAGETRAKLQQMR